MKENIPNDILIICDTAKIGGIERLTLDQAYELSRKFQKSKIIILVLSPRVGNLSASFVVNESEIIKNLRINIFYAPGTKLNQFNFLKVLLKENNISHIFANSLRGSVISWWLRVIYRLHLTIYATIYQLPSLTSTNQHLRRAFYSQFSDRLFIFSSAAQKDWNYRRKKSFLVRMVSSRRKAELCRTGVYLPRLPSREVSETNFDVKRLVYIGRLTAWKGLETFLKVTQLDDFNDTEILLVTPVDPTSHLANVETSLRNRIQSVIGKSISEIEFRDGDLHLYPATYGDNTFVEGISINVLEMACLGIPSLVTKNGCTTWPELQNLGLVYEVDWSKTSTIVSTINKISIKPRNVSKARLVIDIKNNLSQMLVNL